MVEPRFRIQAMTRDRYGRVPNPREVPADVLDEEIPQDGARRRPLVPDRRPDVRL